MSHEHAIEIIRDTLAHVKIERIIVAYDPELGEDVANVYVDADALSDALGKDGCHARNAAMRSGLAVELQIAAPSRRRWFRWMALVLLTSFSALVARRTVETFRYSHFEDEPIRSVILCAVTAGLWIIWLWPWIRRVLPGNRRTHS